MFALTQRRIAHTSAFILAAIAFTIPSFARPKDAIAQEFDGNVTTEDVADDTEELVGRVVTVRSEVEEVVDSNSFFIRDEGFLSSEEILVINDTGEVFILPEVGDVEVQVTGVVRILRAEEIQASGFDIELDISNLFGPDDPRAVIIAQSLALAPDPGDIEANPEAFYGQRIVVEAEVDNIIDANTFTVDRDMLFDDDDLLIVTAQPHGLTEEQDENRDLVITGILRPFTLTEFETDYNLVVEDLEIRRQLEVEFENRPALVVDRIYVTETE